MTSGGRLVETICRGTDGQPAFRREGYAIERRTYDERGNPAETAYLDAAERPALSSGGFAGIRTSWDEAGNDVETTWLGVDGARTTTRKDARRPTGSSDDRGLVTEETCLGVDGRPAPSLRLRLPPSQIRRTREAGRGDVLRCGREAGDARGGLRRVAGDPRRPRPRGREVVPRPGRAAHGRSDGRGAVGPTSTTHAATRPSLRRSARMEHPS